MKKSLLTRIFLTTTVALSVTVFIALIMGHFLVQKYYIQIKVHELKPEVEGIAKEIEKTGKSNAPLNKLSFIIKAYDNMKNEMQVFQNPFKAPDFDIDKDGLYSGDGIYRSIEPFMNRVILGNEITEITNLKGIKGTSIIIGVPIYRNGQIVGGLFLLKPVSDYSSALKGFYMAFLIVGMMLILILCILIYFLLRRIINPLEKMIETSNSMAQGEYQIRIKDKGYGEVGQLAESLNTLAESLEITSKRALQLEQARRDYFSNISHELRTPLSSIRARSEALKDGMIKTEVDRQHYYGEILKESIRLQCLIRDMLELSKLRSGHKSMVKATVETNSLLNDVYEKFVPIADDLDLNWIKDYGNEFSVTWTNHDRIEQVLIILIDNAFKFTGTKGIVKLSAAESDEKVIISVSDSGIGISEEELPFVFERFYKEDKAHATEGTGLGLAIAKQIITELGETIWIESRLGNGSKFYFTLSKKT